MAEQIRIPTIRVPGLVSDEALQEHLRQFRQQQNVARGILPPSSAVEFADHIQSEFIDQPANRAIERSPKMKAQDALMNERSSAVAGFRDSIPGAGFLGRAGQLTPEEGEAEKQERIRAAEEEVKRIESAEDAARRAEWQKRWAEQNEMRGVPVGGLNEQSLDEAKQAQEQLAVEAREKLAKETLAPAPTQTWWLHNMRTAVKGFTGSVTAGAAGAVGMVELGAYLAGIGDGERSDVRAWIETVDQVMEKVLPTDKAQAEDFLSAVAAGGGSMLGFLVGGAALRLVGLPRTAATTIMGAAMGGGSQIQDAEKYTTDALTKYVALLMGGALGATEAIPINRMLGRVEQSTGGLVSRMLSQTTAGTMEEFIQELGQSIGQDLIGMVYDETREINIEDALFNAAAGGIVGGTTAGGIQLITETGLMKPQTAEDTGGEETPEVDDAQIVEIVNDAVEQSQRQFEEVLRPVEMVESVASDEAIAEAVDLAAQQVATQPPREVEEVQPEEVPVLSPSEIAEEVLARGTKRPSTTIANEFVEQLPRPPIFDRDLVEGPGGHVPAPTNENGTITLRHYSPEPRAILDPAFTSTGPVRGAERAFLFGPDAVGRVYYGIGGGLQRQQPVMTENEYATLSPEEREGALKLARSYTNVERVENALRYRYQREMEQRDYVREDRKMGPLQHEVEIDPKTLYNIQEDVLNLKAQIGPKLVGGERITRLERLIRDAGFAGYYSTHSPIGRTVALFEAARPQRIIDIDYGLPLEEIATPADFQNPTAETFRKGGWAALTATREAFGDPSTPENVAANKQLRDRLEKENIPFIPVGGTYGGVDQGESFIIFAPEAKARELGREFGQESILTREGLEFTDDSGRDTVPAVGATLSPPETLEDDYTALPGGTRFSLKLDFDGAANAARAREIEQVQVDERELEPLEGNKQGKPVESVVRAARAYAKSRGLPIRRQATYVRVDPDRARRIAQAYEDMEHAPDDPEVAAAYEAMIEETLAQYQYVKATGLVVEAIEEGQPDPYPEGPRQVLEDLERGHLWFFPTDQGFGTINEVSDNPLLAPTEERIGDRVLLANDVFRIVHDFFGHGIEGSGFGARGEENAWQSHMRLYSEAALPAVTSETRGQNSWVNYGPHGEANRANPRETIYADQKTGIMPDWTWREGVDDEFFDYGDDELLGQRAASPERMHKLMEDVPGFKGVAKHLSDQELATTTKRTAKTIVDIFTNLPPPEEMASVAIAGQAKRGWYARSAQSIIKIFGVEDAPRFAALLAALSPQTSVESNAVNALKVWGAWVKAGRPTDTKTVLKLLRANVQGDKGKVLNAWVNNSYRALSAPDALEVVLSGPKVSAFAANLRGAVDEVTNDTWMAVYAGISQSLFKGRQTSADEFGGVMTASPGYKAMAAAVRAAAEAASEITGETWTPAEIQESIWSWTKALYERTSLRDTAEQLIEMGGLTDEVIAETPDFATLFQTGVYRTILERAGYDLTTLERGDGDAGGAGRRGAADAGQGATPDQRSYERHLRNAARRLDALRQQRAEAEGFTPEIAEDLEAEPLNEPPLNTPLDEDDARFLDEFFAQTAGARHGFNAEQQRQPRAGGTDPAQGDITLSRIADNLIRLLDVTVRQGRFTLRGSDVAGQFSRRTGVVRLRSWNDLSTLVHEAGHSLQFSAGGPLGTFIQNNRHRLAEAARRLYGGDVDALDADQQVAEGFAEFFRVYVLNKAYADRHLASLSQQFTTLLDQTAPEMRDGLNAIRDQFGAWMQLPSAQLLTNMIVTGRQETGVNAALAELRDMGFGTWMREHARSVLTVTTNRYAGLNKTVADILNISEAELGQAVDLKRAEDPRVLIRMAVNSGSRAMVELTDGVHAYRSTVPSSRSLREALLRYHGLGPDQNLSAVDPVREKDFGGYLAALRGLDEERRRQEGKLDRPPIGNMKPADFVNTVKAMDAKYGPDFAKAAEIVHEYGMALWQKAYDAGLMTKETYLDGLDRRFYAPLQRDMSDRDVTFGEQTSSVGQGRSIVKRFKGSDRDIINPMDALVQKTFALERVIAENDVKLALASLADKAGQVGALVERVPARQILGEQFDVGEVARQLTKDPSINEAEAQDLMRILETSIEEGNRIALFRSQQAATKGENIVFFWEKGRLSAIQLHDGSLGADVVNVLNSLGRETLPVFVDLIAATSTVFRASVTSWPDFLLVNFIRDQVSAWILTNVGYKPFVTGLRGVGDELRQNEWARSYNAAMGIMGGMNTAALHKARVERDISALRKKGYFVRAFGEGGFTGAVKGIARVTELTETGTRLGVYRRAYERAKADGLTDYEASVEAAYLATDLIDFGLNGSRMLLLRRTIPFLNAQIQGLYKMMRTLGADEVAQRKGLMFVLRAYFKDINGLNLSRTEKQALRTGRKAWAKMASLGLISGLLYAMFWDDPDYQDASEYLRATGWVIPVGDGRLFYIPKPFELAVIANFVERGLEMASGDKEAKNRMLRGAAMNLTPPTSPPAIQVLVEEIANFDFFSGREIVPDHMLALAPELQYNHYTSEFAKQIGETFGWSPMRVDHILSGLGASAYRDLVGAYNMTDPNRPQSDATDWFVTRRFVRDARRGATSSQDFWDQASTRDGALRRAEVSYKELLESGRAAAAEQFLSTLGEDERAYALLNTHFKAEYKRLNPFYRARQLSTIVSALRREFTSELGVEDTSSAFSEPIMLTASDKNELDTLLSEFIRREVRNTMIYMGEPGWSNKQPLPVDPTLALIREVDWRVADELERRIMKAKVYSDEVVRDNWPDVRDRLLQDRENAYLKDILAIAKVMR